MIGDWDNGCPYCRINDDRGKCVRIEPCGLTGSEHSELAKLRKQAEEQARLLVVEARKREILPQAILKAVYDEAERNVRRNPGQSG